MDKKHPAWPPFPWTIRQVEFFEDTKDREKGMYWQGKNNLTGETTALYKEYFDVYLGIDLANSRKYADKWGGM